MFEEIARLAQAGRASALATLIKVQGSSYRRPGAKLLIRDDGTMLGNVSGGCLENDLRERALRVIESGAPEMVHYDTGADENTIWGLGLGCNGKLDVYLQRAPPGVESVRKKLSGDAPFELRAGEFVEMLQPPPPLVIVGGGDDAMPLVRMAVESGFRLTLVDHRPAYLKPESYPGVRRILQKRAEDGLNDLPHGPDTLVIIKNHAINADRTWAQLYAATPVRYIGLLGPQARRDEILKAIPGAQRERIFGPAGLDLGSEGPEQIALSIVAELLAIMADRPAGHLREQTRPIH